MDDGAGDRLCVGDARGLDYLVGVHVVLVGGKALDERLDVLGGLGLLADYGLVDVVELGLEVFGAAECVVERIWSFFAHGFLLCFISRRDCRKVV